MNYYYKSFLLYTIYTDGIELKTGVILKVLISGICGSDLHLFFNEVPGTGVMQKGDILGHEGKNKQNKQRT